MKFKELKKKNMRQYLVYNLQKKNTKKFQNNTHKSSPLITHLKKWAIFFSNQFDNLNYK